MNRQFGALLGLAILLVILNHSIGMGLDTARLGYPPPAEGWFYYLLSVLHQLGVFAVPTFLFISGCFFAYAGQGNDPPVLSWKVVRAGLKHILWPYLFWSVVFYLWIYFRWNEAYSLAGYLKNLVVGFPFHFVPLIAFYYLISPFLIRLASRFGAISILVIGLYQLILIGIVFPDTLGFSLPDWLAFFAPPALRYTLALWAIYFPLGMIYSINAKRVLPWLYKFRWLSLTMTIVIFVSSILDRFSVWHMPLAGFICPLTFLLFAPTLKRGSIPWVRELEKLGKMSYGLYLTNLLVLDCLLFAFDLFVPWLFNYQLLLQPALFILTLWIPLALMNGTIRLSSRPLYRFVFG